MAADAVHSDHIVDGTITGSDINSLSTVVVTSVETTDLKMEKSAAAAPPSCDTGEIKLDPDSSLCWCWSPNQWTCLPSSVVAWNAAVP